MKRNNEEDQEVPRKKVKKKELLEIAKEDVQTLILKANSAFDSANLEEAFELYHFIEQCMGTICGHVYYRLGVMYQKGVPVSRNPELSTHYFELAFDKLQKEAEQGDADANCDLGYMFDHGFGVEVNKTLAVKYYQHAADLGLCRGQYNLGYMFENGDGIPKDKTMAIKYYERAGSQGDADAYCNLGYLYDHGDGIEQDKVKAVKYYQLSVDRGNARAQCNLGYMYHLGEGVEKDKQRAHKYYQMSADQGNAQAQYNLGCLYQEGDGVEKDDQMAIKYYKMAAQQAHISSHYNLGYTYETGEGTKQDYKLALKHFLFAATKDSDAREHVAEIFRGSSEKERERVDVDWTLYRWNAIQMLSDEWPFRHCLLNSNCQCTILEIFLVFRKLSWEFYDIIPIVTKILICIWPENHFIE